VPIDGVLDAWGEVLDPHREPVEAERSQQGNLLVGRDPWVDLDRDFRLWVDLEVAGDGIV